MGSMLNIYFNYIENSLYNYFKFLLGKDYKYKIVRLFIEKYIDVRYYNNSIYKDKNLADKLGKEFKLIAKELIKEDEEDSDLIKNICALFGYVLYFDDYCDYADLGVLVDSLFDEEYVKVSPNIKGEFTSFIKETISKKESYHNLFRTNNFKLEYKRLKRNLVKVNINNSIEISKLYSDYAKDKAFNEGIINEDKRYVLIRMLSEEILLNSIKGDYSLKYVIDLPESFFDKQKKFKRLISMLDNDLIKDHISLKVTYEEYIRNKDIINNSISSGINYSLELDKTFDNDFNCFVLFKNVIVYEYLDCYDIIIDDKESFNTSIVIL